MFSKLNSISSIEHSKNKNESPFTRRYIDISDGKYGKIKKVPSISSNSFSRNRLTGHSTHSKSQSSFQLEMNADTNSNSKKKKIGDQKLNMDLPKPKTVLRPPKPKIIQKVEKYFESQKKSESKHEEEQNKGKDLQPKNQDQRVKQIMDDIDQAIEESSQDDTKKKGKRKKRKNLTKFLVNQSVNKSEIDDQINIQIKSNEQTSFNTQKVAEPQNKKQKKEQNIKSVKEVNQKVKKSLKFEIEQPPNNQKSSVKKKIIEHRAEIIDETEEQESNHKIKRSRNKHKRKHYISESYTEQLFNRLHNSKSIGELFPEDILNKFSNNPKRLKNSKFSIDKLGILDQNDLKLLNLCQPKRRGHTRSYSNLKRRKLRQNRRLSENKSQERKEQLINKYTQHKEKMNLVSKVLNSSSSPENIGSKSPSEPVWERLHCMFKENIEKKEK